MAAGFEFYKDTHLLRNDLPTRIGYKKCSAIIKNKAQTLYDMTKPSTSMSEKVGLTTGNLAQHKWFLQNESKWPVHTTMWISHHNMISSKMTLWGFHTDTFVFFTEWLNFVFVRCPFLNSLYPLFLYRITSTGLYLCLFLAFMRWDLGGPVYEVKESAFHKCICKVDACAKNLENTQCLLAFFAKHDNVHFSQHGPIGSR